MTSAAHPDARWPFDVLFVLTVLRLDVDPVFAASDLADMAVGHAKSFRQLAVRKDAKQAANLVDFSGGQLGPMATPDVLRSADKLQMVKIHAGAITTNMIDLETIRDRPMSALKEVSISQVRATPAIYSGVAVMVQLADPIPAAGDGIDFIGNGIASDDGSGILGMHRADLLTRDRKVPRPRRATPRSVTSLPNIIQDRCHYA